ncbi:hypothetical protein B7494_g5095 [Chlorociboria aeruginascens]|nr:hypothetical protein B7494_g5095 [Chlorociboria aeruginascens]
MLLQSETRRKRNFEATESQLPALRSGPTEDGRPSLVERIISRLGRSNPVSKAITNNDTVWLLDNTAYRTSTNEWEAEFVAAVFDGDTGTEVSSIVAAIAEKVGLAKNDTAEATIRERLIPFVQAILPGRAVEVDFVKRVLDLGPCSDNGISSDIRPLPHYKGGEVIPSVAKVPRGTGGIVRMKTVYAEPEDIDDTIKITQTSDPIGILMSTFVSTPTPTSGMPELYTHIQTLITDAAPFFYLSASPYNLYPFLSNFRQQYYPQGTMILRDASWMTLGGLLSSLTVGTQEYKVDRMKKINSWLPKRKMICIGDSTQSDPEAYGEISRQHPGWVRLILIRKVTDIAAVGMDEKNMPGRFTKAFEGVKEGTWHVFESPEECHKIVEDLVASDSP